MCGRQGILQERMRNRSCVGCELMLDFLFNWISLFFYVFAVNVRFVWGYELLVLCNFFFAFAVDVDFECCLEQDQPNNAWIK